MWFFFALLSVACWSLVSAIESMVVQRYEQNPVVLMWFIGLFRVLPLAGIVMFYDIRTEWALPLFLFGFIYFLGGVAYYFVIEKIDVSVFNTNYAIQSIMLSIVGFTLFEERWTLLQTIGSIIAICSIIFVSHWHKHVSVLRTVFLLSLVALLFVPNEVITKAAVDAEQTMAAILFWSLLGNITFSITTPFFLKSFRMDMARVLKRTQAGFYASQLLIVALSVAGMVAVLTAYDIGTLSLVAITFNAMPFLVMGFAWAFARYIPKYSAKEILTAQSVHVKLIGFAGVFAGLLLLVVG